LSLDVPGRYAVDCNGTLRARAGVTIGYNSRPNARARDRLSHGCQKRSAPISSSTTTRLRDLLSRCLTEQGFQVGTFPMRAT
jgi:hypothetical protein